MGEYTVKNIKRLVSTVLVTMFAFSAAGCSMIEKTPEAIAKSPVAVVNGEKITRGELDKSAEMMSVAAQLKQKYGESYEKNDEAKEILKAQRQTIVDNMVTQKVIEQKAKELNLMPNESKLKSEVNKQYDETKKQLESSGAKFEDVLKNEGFTQQSLKDFLLIKARNNEIYNNVVDNLSKNIKIDDKKVEEYYNSNKNQFTEKPNKIRVSHILVKTEDEAKKVKERLNKGEDFAKVAKEVSTDTATKDKGGDLGTVPYVDSGFDPAFMSAAIALKEGAISEPVQTSYGYHIIKAIDKEEYPVKKLDTVKDEIKKQLEDEEKQKVVSQKVEDWKKAAKIKTYEKNLE